MTRRLLGFIGVAGLGLKGQARAKQGPQSGHVGSTWSGPPGFTGYPKPANGDCPVCWTAAQKLYLRNTGFAECVGVGDGLTVKCTNSYEKKRTELIRCSHCSTAFFQDAEDVKP